MTDAVPAVEGSIVQVGTLTRCALPHSVCDLKTALMNVKRRLIQKLYKFELSHNDAVEATKNIFLCKIERHNLSK